MGYWLWEPATGCVIHTLTIPRGQTAMASGTAAADAKTFELVATQGLSTWGICSAPFLEYAFKTTAFTIKVTVNDDDKAVRENRLKLLNEIREATRAVADFSKIQD